MPGMFNDYPYTDLHEMNLDMFLEELKNLEARVKALEDEVFEEVNENGN